MHSLACPESASPTPGTERAEQWLCNARHLATSELCAQPVRALFAQLALLRQILFELPTRLLEAPDEEARRLLRQSAEDLDWALYAALGDHLSELYERAAVADTRLAGFGEALMAYLEAAQHHHRAALRARGIQRIAPTPGGLLDPRESVAVNREPHPCRHAELAGRVARVCPGEAGWRFKGQVICHARAEVYAREVSPRDLPPTEALTTRPLAR